MPNSEFYKGVLVIRRDTPVSMKTLFLDFCPKIRHVLRKNEIEFITFYRCHTHFSPFVRKSWFEGGEGQNFQVPVWARSILVNGILYLGLFSPLDITSSKYRNGEFNFVSCSNLLQWLRIMYNMLIHGPTRFWPLWCPIRGFIRGFSHPTRHTSLCENFFFRFWTQNLACIKEK